MTMQEHIERVKVKEQELLELLQAKSVKLANTYLAKSRHTQLSYLSEEEQAYNVSVPKEILLDRLIVYLKQI